MRKIDSTNQLLIVFQPSSPHILFATAKNVFPPFFLSPSFLSAAP